MQAIAHLTRRSGGKRRRAKPARRSRTRDGSSTGRPAPGNEERAPAWRLPIATYLGIGLGSLVATALGVLLWVTLSTAFKNTTELLEDKSRLFLGALTAQTRQFLDTTLAPSAVAVNEISSGRVDPRDDEQVKLLLRTLLAASPQIKVLAFFDVDETSVAAYWVNGGVRAIREPWPDQNEIRNAMKTIRSETSPVWGKPIYNRMVGTVVNLRQPVFRDGEFLGMVAAVINVQVLSAFLGSLETEIGQNAFILYRRDFVLAHRRLTRSFVSLNESRPLPRVTEIGDPILARIWRKGWEENRLVAGSGHADDQGDQTYIFLYEPLDDYADTPWLVGSYFPNDAVSGQFQRMAASAVISLMIVLLTIAAIYLFGRFLRRPIVDLAEAASLVRGLDLDRVPTIRPSRVAELDDAGRAFNSMVAALGSFSIYVPKSLVTQLVEAGDAKAIRSEVKPVTIMMTDIVGFTTRAETMTAEQTAAFLNEHLALITSCIEAKGGVVDKYMGDAVMAHWGALGTSSAQTIKAARAAIAIQEAIYRDNDRRGDPVRLRIGLHCGDVVAGNIGTTTRLNYTVVGDTVNMAQRLEALGKTILPDDEVAVLMSAEVRYALDHTVPTRSLGFHELRGREAEVEVFTFAD